MSAGRPPEDDDFDDDDEDGAEVGAGRPAGRSGIFPDAWRRAIASGANALFTTEEGGPRGPLGDLRLPKEVIQFILSQTDRTRRDVGRIAAKELHRLLRNVDLGGELRRSLLGIRVRVRAEVTFEETGPRLQVHSDVVPRQGRHQGATPPAQSGSPVAPTAPTQPAAPAPENDAPAGSPGPLQESPPHSRHPRGGQRR